MKFTLLILIFVMSCVIVDSIRKRVHRRKGLHTSTSRPTQKPKNKETNMADEISSIVEKERSIIDKHLLTNYDHDLTLNKKPVTNNKNIIYNDRPIINHVHQYDIPLPLHDLPGANEDGNMYLHDGLPHDHYDTCNAHPGFHEHIYRDDLNHLVHVVHVADKLANIGHERPPLYDHHGLYEYPHVHHHYGDGLTEHDHHDIVHYIYDDELKDHSHHGLYDYARVYHHYTDPLLNDVQHDLHCHDHVYHYSDDELYTHDRNDLHGHEHVYHYYYDGAHDHSGPHDYNHVYADGYGQPVYSVVHDKV